MSIDLLTRQEKGSPLDHQEIDANFIAIQQELERKTNAADHEGAGGSAHALASTESDGFMSKEDKARLDAVADEAASVGDANPVGLGEADPGDSPFAARQDHVHPSTGTTQATADSSDEYATTEFVHNVVDVVAAKKSNTTSVIFGSGTAAP